jgi:hypothetical protein
MNLFKKSFIGVSILFLVVLGGVLISAHKAYAAVTVGVTANGQTSLTVSSGTLVTIRWESTGAVSCKKTDSVNDTVDVVLLNNEIGFQTTVYQTTTFYITCTDVVPGQTSYKQSYYPTSCFTANTVVTLSDGRKEDIQDVKVGDILKGETTNNKVLGLHRPTLDGKLYSLNGGRYFVTEEHPFKTLTGWKSINPTKTLTENIGVKVTELKVGDTLITDKGQVLLKSINSKEGKENTGLYNFILDGDHTYYADGYLVHNKSASRTPCSDSCTCVSNYGVPGIPPSMSISSDNFCALPCENVTAGDCTSNSGYTTACVGSLMKCIDSRDPNKITYTPPANTNTDPISVILSAGGGVHGGFEFIQYFSIFVTSYLLI